MDLVRVGVLNHWHKNQIEEEKNLSYMTRNFFLLVVLTSDKIDFRLYLNVSFLCWEKRVAKQITNNLMSNAF